MPVKQVLIVTDKEHWEQCSFLLDSIDFYLNGYYITVVDNTPTPCNLFRALTNNYIKFVPWNKIISSRVIKDGFDFKELSHRLINLSACKIFKNDYVCLDSTNVILKSFENSNWPIDKWPTTPKVNHSSFDFYLAACRKFDLDLPALVPSQTPFIFNSDQVNDMLRHLENFEDWFTSFKNPSEFWLYDLWLQKNGLANHTVSDHYIQEPLLLLHNKLSWDYIKAQYQSFDYFTVGCINSSLWEDPNFTSIIQDKGLNFLKP